MPTPPRAHGDTAGRSGTNMDKPRQRRMDGHKRGRPGHFKLSTQYIYISQVVFFSQLCGGGLVVALVVVDALRAWSALAGTHMGGVTHRCTNRVRLITLCPVWDDMSGW